MTEEKDLLAEPSQAIRRNGGRDRVDQPGSSQGSRHLGAGGACLLAIDMSDQQDDFLAQRAGNLFLGTPKVGVALGLRQERHEVGLKADALLDPEAEIGASDNHQDQPGGRDGLHLPAASKSRASSSDS